MQNVPTKLALATLKKKSYYFEGWRRKRKKEGDMGEREKIRWERGQRTEAQHIQKEGDSRRERDRQTEDAGESRG